MKNFYTIISLLLFFFPEYSNGQYGTLVEDFYVGPQGSINSKGVLLKDNVYYIGTPNDTTDRSLLKYNISSNEISVVTPSNDLVFTRLDIHATENNIYMNSFFGLYQYNPSSNAMNLIFWTDPFDIFSKIYMHQGVFVLTAFESGTNSWTAYYYNEKTGITKKMMDNIDMGEEELLVTMGDDYIAIRSSVVYSDPVIPSSIYDKNNGDILAIEEIIPEYDCDIQYNLHTSSSYLIYECDFDYIIFDKNTMQSEVIEVIIKEAYENSSHLFAQSTGALWSIDKQSYEVQVLNDNWQRPLKYFEDKFYLLDYVDNVLLVFDGNEENTKRIDIDVELNFRSELLDVIRVGEKVLIAFDQNIDKNSIYELREDELVLVLENLHHSGLINLIFLEAQGKLLFTYENEIYGEELFLLDLETNAIKATNEFPFYVYPNPAGNHLILDKNRDQYKASIINSLGMHCTNLNTGVNDISMLSNGVYYINVVDVSNGKNYIKPIIISK
ncbi:MAG: T9SS type A sorting domain-containing protein [Bacteroidota bacterium]